MRELSFQEAIRSGDPLATLVYADWLEENGRAEESGWLRSGQWRLIPAGSFWMGGGGGKPGKQLVPIPHAFYLGTYPVTQGEWEAVMGTNPSWFSREGGGNDKVKDIKDEELKQFPVEMVSWDDVQEFLQRLNAAGTHGEWTYRLPTEAEWEYSCRGGATSKKECSFHFYLTQPANALCSTQANFNGNHPAGRAAKGPYLERTSKVGSYQPNRLGLYDMHGNVWEWTDSLWEEEGSGRVSRGGGWAYDGARCQAAFRYWFAPTARRSTIGCRLARVPVR